MLTFMNNLYDLNNLYMAYKASKRNSGWKPEVQRFEMNWLSELSTLQKELETRTYRTSKGSKFTLNERGKIRHIVGSRMRDRVARHSLCDNSLTPAIDKYLIYDNGASRAGRGITFSRTRLLKHLRNYYYHHGNKGYILLMDFSKYYDNIRHDDVRRQFAGKLEPDAAWLLDLVLKDFEVDISYMNDNEYTECLSKKYDSLQAPRCETGKKFMRKSVNIGDQVSQVVGIYYPTRIDNYVKIVRSQKYYGRYMDDSYIISPSKEELKSILSGIAEIADSLGIYINTRKTQIYKLSHGFRYLQNWYALTDTGRVIIKINTKRLTAMRRKLKKLARKIMDGELPQNVIEDLFRSWFTNYYKIMSKKQRENLCNLYNNLTEMIKNGNRIE